MRTDPPTIRSGARYREIVELLHDAKLHAVPVVDSAEQLTGVVSVSDLLRYPERRTARELMSSPVLTADPDMLAARAAQRAARADVNQLPVVDEHDHVVGLVTRLDLLRLLTVADEEVYRSITDDVLARQFCLEPGTVDVSVHEGVVTLHGQVEQHALREPLLTAVHSVPGVVAVQDQLSWPQPATSDRPLIPHIRAT